MIVKVRSMLGVGREMLGGGNLYTEDLDLSSSVRPVQLFILNEVALVSICLAIKTFIERKNFYH